MEHDYSNWQVTEKGLFRSLQFDNFTKLTQLLARLGTIADAIKHHPHYIEIRDARILDVYLITHDKNKVTGKDYNQAFDIDTLYQMVLDNGYV
ncbi:MAG: 4a-hydroxytetrahydrobiopterin dehydratase [Bacteroidota bacterium]